ncbi:MAG: cytidylate kinase-like family protein [Chloroflexi bacterium]|nr:cytidylate kinase-like family protein [Chloroflexota bacterium]
MAIVTLSRQLGAGGSEIAAGVAKALGLRIIDREAIDCAALEAGVPEIALHELGYEGRRGLMQRILDALKASPAIPSIVEMERRESVLPIAMTPRGIFTPAMPLLSAAMEDYVRIVGMVILNIAQEGNVLIIGRGSQVLLKDNPEALHVKVIAPLPRRVEKLMRIEGITQREAAQRILASDQARAEYLRRYYGVNWLDPQLYDLVINTGRISIQTAVQLVVMAQVQRVIPEAS